MRVECASHQAARELAEQLEAEGYKPERRSQYLIVGAASREDADALATRLHGQVEPGGELVYEVEPSNPFAIFGGLGMYVALTLTKPGSRVCFHLRRSPRGIKSRAQRIS